jgi:hypothetical protein
MKEIKLEGGDNITHAIHRLIAAAPAFCVFNSWGVEVRVEAKIGETFEKVVARYDEDRTRRYEERETQRAIEEQRVTYRLMYSGAFMALDIRMGDGPHVTADLLASITSSAQEAAHVIRILSDWGPKTSHGAQAASHWLRERRSLDAFREQAPVVICALESPQETPGRGS